MHRTQIYLQDDLYARLKAQSVRLGISISELIRRSLEKEIDKDSLADARAFFARLEPLESFANQSAAEYVRELRGTSRLLKGRTK